MQHFPSQSSVPSGLPEGWHKFQLYLVCCLSGEQCSEQCSEHWAHHCDQPIGSQCNCLPLLIPSHLIPFHPIPPHPTPENAYSATTRYMTMQERLFYTPPQRRHDHCVCFLLHWSGSFNRHCGDPSAADDGADQHVCCSSTWGSIRCYFGGLCKPLHIKYKLLVIWKQCYAPFIHYFIVGSIFLNEWIFI